MKMHILIIKIFLLMVPLSVSSFAQKESSLKTVIDTIIISVQSSVVDSQQITIKKEVAIKPEPAPVHDEKTDWMSEKIGMGALAIFATLAVIILYNKTN